MRTRTSATELQDKERAGDEREGEGDELGVLLGEHGGLVRVAMVGFVEADEDKVGDVDAACVELALDNVDEEVEEDGGADEGDGVDDLESVQRHLVVPHR